jgi:hypothetical protein
MKMMHEFRNEEIESLEDLEKRTKNLELSPKKRLELKDLNWRGRVNRTWNEVEKEKDEKLIITLSTEMKNPAKRLRHPHGKEIFVDEEIVRQLT